MPGHGHRRDRLLHAHGLAEVARAAVVSGFIGGIGFAAASMLKLVEVTSGYVTNWHSILEQTTGLFNGIGIAVAMHGLARRTRTVDSRFRARDEQPQSRASGCRFCDPGNSLCEPAEERGGLDGAGAVPQVMYGISAWAWFDLAAVAVAVAMVVLMARHLRRPLAVVPDNPLGQGQGLFLLLLAIMVIGNFERALVGFKDQRLVTEGVIHLNALLCAVILLTADHEADHERRIAGGQSPPARWARLVAMGSAAALIAILADWAIVRGLYGDRFAGHAGHHIRFGPNATTSGPRNYH